MIIDNNILDELTSAAEANERRRTVMDLRNSADDQSQRVMNAMCPDTVVPIHRHRTTNETMIVVRGSVRSIFYNDAGEEIMNEVIAPREGRYAITIPKGIWHTAQSLEPGTVIFEGKDGSFAPLDKDDILSQ